jgi:hypothetical protein
LSDHRQAIDYGRAALNTLPAGCEKPYLPIKTLSALSHESRLWHSVIPTEVEGSHAACGAQEETPRRVKRLRICNDLCVRPEDEARSLDYPLGCARGFGSPG